MVRKTKTPKTTVAYVNLTDEEVGAIVMASSGHVKTKPVDPRKIVGMVHIKKYIADAKINKKVETWISVLKKMQGETAELTSADVEELEKCKKACRQYLKKKSSKSLRDKVESADMEDPVNLQKVASSMKYKFSRYAYEAVTHTINLMIREILTLTCDNCASQKAKLTKAVHIPWGNLQSTMLSGLFMNTDTVYGVLHPTVSEVVEETVVEESEAVVDEAVVDEAVVDEEVVEESDDAEEVGDVETVTKTSKPKLSQYISNTFKEIVSRDERFKGLLLNKEIVALVDKLVYEVLDRYTDVIKSLLQAANSKTVNKRLAIIACKILLQAHVGFKNEDVQVVLDVVHARLAEMEGPQKQEAHQKVVAKAKAAAIAEAVAAGATEADATAAVDAKFAAEAVEEDDEDEEDSDLE